MNKVNREILVIGGTGMLMPFVKQFDSSKILLAARFQSNFENLSMLDPNISKLELDYENAASINQFFETVDGVPNLKAVILWVHSNGHPFSKRLMQLFAKRKEPPKIIHIFGTGQNPQTQLITSFESHAANLNLDFSAVRLGSLKTDKGARWLTHEEISDLTMKAFLSLTKT